MNKFTVACYQSLNSVLISLFILIVTTAVVVKNVSAEAVYTEQGAFSEGELVQILAPVALYPDSLLTHILIASTYPLEIVQANRWRTENRHLSAAQAVKKSERKGWDPSVSALLAFPNVLEKLSDDLSWTQKLGDAFLQDEAALLSAIQLLRQQADEAGNLSEMENMSVTRADNQIIIEPVEKEIVYVPYYDSRVVYGHWYWYSYPPVYWMPYPYYVAHLHSHFYWGSAIHIAFNYYFSSFNWHHRHIVVVNHQHSHHYRHRERIVASHGAQRWTQKAKHRHGVVYRSQHVKQRDRVRPPMRIMPNRVENKLREQRTEVKKEYSRDNLPTVNKHRAKPPFSKRLDRPLVNKQQKQTKGHKVIPGYPRDQAKNYHRNQGEGKRQKQIKKESMPRNRYKYGGNGRREWLPLDHDYRRR